MITSENVITTLSNSKFKKIQLPTSSKYSQFDCYEAKRREMEILVTGLKSLTEMTDIGKALNTDSILDELANQYGAHTLKVADPGAVLGSEKLSTATIDYETFISYQENELISAPPAFMDLVSGVAPTQRVFLYGLKNPESFYKAVLVASRPDFITKTKQNRVNDIFTFKKEIGMSVRDPVRAKEYLRVTDPSFNPDTISGNLVDKETYVDDALAQATCDFVGRSRIVFDLVGKSFKTYRTGFWTTDKLGETYILIMYQGAYLPVIHVDTRNLLDGDALAAKLVSQFEHVNRDQYKFRDLEIMNGANRRLPDGGKVRSALNDPYFDPSKLIIKSDISFDDIQSKIAAAVKTKEEQKAVKAVRGKLSAAAKSTINSENTNGIDPVLEPSTAPVLEPSTAPVLEPIFENLKTAKLPELQEIATGLGIDVMTAGAGGKPKKKTKDQLVLDITTARTITK